jgi:predicted transcriptional regulator
MERTVVYQMTPADLKAFLIEEVAKKDLNAARDELLKRFENTWVGIRELAAIHGVSRMTVINYINDGLIEPEVRTAEKGKYRFRLNYVLTLDFDELKQQLKERTYL